VMELLEGETLRHRWSPVACHRVAPSTSPHRSCARLAPLITRASSIATSNPRTSS
jgi:hypothetical protein